MKKHWLLLSVMLLAFLCACHKDDDNDVAPSPAQDTTGNVSHVQIMTVFAPGQLGDQGYADRVMRGVNTLAQNQSDKIDTYSTDVDFIASYDVESTRESLKAWTYNDKDPATGKKYGKRLLVLTELYMTQWLIPLKDSLRPTDEILLLKSNADDVSQAAKQLNMEDRVYGLNISATGPVRLFCQNFKKFMDKNNHKGDTIAVLRLYNEDITHYRDSIAETIAAESADMSSINLYLMDSVGSLYDTEHRASAFVYAYSFSAVLQQTATYYDEGVFCIVDFGAANKGPDIYMMQHNGSVLMRVLMLDAESNYDMCRFAITRHFDRALSEWTTQWLLNKHDAMPLITIHGDWDGYCTHDINFDLSIF